MAKLINQAPVPEETAQPASPQNHGFSGDTVTVEFLKTNDQEPRDIFVGVNTYQARIMRGKRVTIPVEAFDAIEEAKYLDAEEDAENPLKKNWVEKQRFPYNVISRQSAAVPA